MNPKSIKIADYHYDLPDDRIAKYPLPDRSESRLLLYRDGNIEERHFRDIPGFIPKDSLMVFNDTRVVHARLLFQKSTGGIIEVFCLSPANGLDIAQAMLQKGSVSWHCMIGGASKWKPGLTPQLKTESFALSATITGRAATDYIVQLSWDDASLTFSEVLHIAGKMPLPPYLHRNAEPEDEVRYQTIFARHEGSVAAPTAGLHFTDKILSEIRNTGIQTDFVTLHVGAGTFKPVKGEVLQEHQMHEEWIEVSLPVLRHLIDNIGRNIVAVGTTSLRTLESLYWLGAKLHNENSFNPQELVVGQWEPYEAENTTAPLTALQALANYAEHNNLHGIVARTNIIIAPGYRFRIVNGLVTNFHQPGSTLLLLIAAFIGEDWRKVYDYALTNNFRFLSFGDGSLLWRK